jgi:hypothetical protein
MKLFQRLLVAPATLGLFAPLAVNATEVNLNAISDYSDDQIELDSNSFKSFSTEKSVLISGGEGLVDDYSSDSFSTTTTASFKAEYGFGFVDGGTRDATNGDTDDQVNAGYGFQMDLKTSFTGDDELKVEIDAGSPSATGYNEINLNDASETLTIDDIQYTFPLFGATVLVGDGMDGSELFTGACAYGGPGNTLDDCGTPSSAFGGEGNTAIAASYDFYNGWSVSGGYQGEGNNTDGLMTQEGADAVGANVAYMKDNYGISLNTAVVEDVNGVDSTYNGMQVFFAPEGFPVISAGYEYGDVGSAAANVDGRSSYMIGLDFADVGPGTLGIAGGTKTATVEGSEDLMMYEAYYEYPVNDSMTVTPYAYIKEFATGTEDEFGVMALTTFSF